MHPYYEGLREKQVNLRIKNQTEVIPELIFTYTIDIKGHDILKGKKESLPPLPPKKQE